MANKFICTNGGEIKISPIIDTALRKVTKDKGKIIDNLGNTFLNILAEKYIGFEDISKETISNYSIAQLKDILEQAQEILNTRKNSFNIRNAVMDLQLDATIIRAFNLFVQKNDTVTKKVELTDEFDIEQVNKSGQKRIVKQTYKQLLTDNLKRVGFTSQEASDIMDQVEEYIESQKNSDDPKIQSKFSGPLPNSAYRSIIKKFAKPVYEGNKDIYEEAAISLRQAFISKYGIYASDYSTESDKRPEGTKDKGERVANGISRYKYREGTTPYSAIKDSFIEKVGQCKVNFDKEIIIHDNKDLNQILIEYKNKLYQNLRSYLIKLIRANVDPIIINAYFAEKGELYRKAVDFLTKNGKTPTEEDIKNVISRNIAEQALQKYVNKYVNISIPNTIFENSSQDEVNGLRIYALRKVYEELKFSDLTEEKITEMYLQAAQDVKSGEETVKLLGKKSLNVTIGINDQIKALEAYTLLDETIFDQFLNEEFGTLIIKAKNISRITNVSTNKYKFKTATTTKNTFSEEEKSGIQLMGNFSKAIIPTIKEIDLDGKPIGVNLTVEKFYGQIVKLRDMSFMQEIGKLSDITKVDIVKELIADLHKAPLQNMTQICENILGISAESNWHPTIKPQGQKDFFRALYSFYNAVLNTHNPKSMISIEYADLKRRGVFTDWLLTEAIVASIDRIQDAFYTQYGQDWATGQFGAYTIKKGETDFIEISTGNTIDLTVSSNTKQSDRKALLSKYKIDKSDKEGKLDKETNKTEYSPTKWDTTIKRGHISFIIKSGNNTYKFGLLNDGTLQLEATDREDIPTTKNKDGKDVKIGLSEFLKQIIEEPNVIVLHKALTNQPNTALVSGSKQDLYIKLLNFIDDVLQMSWTQGGGRYDLLETYLRDSRIGNDPLENLKPLLSLAVTALRNHVAYYDYVNYLTKSENSEEATPKKSIIEYVTDKANIPKYGENSFTYDYSKERLVTYKHTANQQNAVSGLARAEQWLSGDLFRARLRNVMGNNVPPNKMYNLAGNLQFFLKQNVNNPILGRNLFVQNYHRYRGTSVKTGLETPSGIKKEVQDFTTSEHLYTALMFDFYEKGYQGYRQRVRKQDEFNTSFKYPDKPNPSKINAGTTIEEASQVEFQATCNSDKKSIHLFGSDSMVVYKDTNGNNVVVDLFRDSSDQLQAAIKDTIGAQYMQLYKQVYEDYRYIFNDDYLLKLAERIDTHEIIGLSELSTKIKENYDETNPGISFRVLTDYDLRNLLTITTLQELNTNAKVTSPEVITKSFVINTIIPNLQAEPYTNKNLIEKLQNLSESVEDFTLSDLYNSGQITEAELSTILNEGTYIEIYENLHYGNLTSSEASDLPINIHFADGKVILGATKLKTLVSNDVLNYMHDNLFASNTNLTRRLALEKRNYLNNLISDYNTRIEYRDPEKSIIKNIRHALWLTGISEEEFEKEWVDLKTQYVILGKAKVNGAWIPINIYNAKDYLKDDVENYVLNGVEIELNPLFERYFMTDFLLSENNRIATTGSSTAHPKKGAKNSAMADMAAIFSDSARTLAHFKRDVAVPATQNPVLQKSLAGPRPMRRVAVYPDRSATMFNIAGEKASEDAHDGSSFDNPFFAVLLNLALHDSAVGDDKKLIDISLNRYGGQVLEKYAVFSQYNERMRQSQGSPVNMRKHVKAWNSFRFDEPIDLNTSIFGKTIKVTDLIPNGVDGGYYMVSLEAAQKEHIGINGESKYFNAGSHRQVTKLVTKDAVNHIYQVTTREVDATGTSVGEEFTEEISINTLWNLFEVFGDCYSESKKNGKLGFSDASILTVVNYMNNIGNQIEGTDPKNLTQDSYYQPLKNTKYMITSATNKSGFKVGVSHLCDSKVWRDPENNLQFTIMSTTGLGPQGDFDHTVAGGEHLSTMTEPSQIISALEANGWTHHIVKQAYEDLGKVAIASIQEVKDAVDIMSKNGFDKESKSELYHFVGELVMKHVLADKKNDIGVANRIMERLEKEFKKLKKGGNISNHESDAFHIGFSDPSVFGVSLAQFTSTLNKEAIKRKFFGEGAIMAPAYDLSCYFTINGQKVLYDDVEAKAIKAGMDVPTFLKSQQFTDNEEALIQVSDAQGGHYLMPLSKAKGNNKVSSLVTVLDGTNIMQKALTQLKDTDKVLDMKPMHQLVPGMKVLVTFSDGTVHYCDMEDFDLYNSIKHGVAYTDTNKRKWYQNDGITAKAMGWTLATYCNINGNPLEGDMEAIGQNMQAQNTYWSVTRINNEGDSETIWYNTYDIPQIRKIIETRRLKEQLKQNISKEEQMAYDNIIQKCQKLISNYRMPVSSNTPGAKIDLETGIAYLDIDQDSIQVDAAEMMISRIQLEQFGLDMETSLASIIEQGSEYFKDKIQNALSLNKVAPTKYSFAFTRANGRHTYIKLSAEGLSRKDSIYNNERANFIVSKRKIWRVDLNGNKMYQVGAINENGEKEYVINIYEDNEGNEILVCNDINYLTNLFKSSQYIAAIPSSESNSSTYGQLIKEILPEESQKLSSFNYIDVLQYYKDNIDELAKHQFSSFLASLDYTVGRIPAQSHQSFMKMKVVGFLNSDKNVVNVSHYQTWLQGSDYDIDKAYIMGSAFDENGLYVAWSSEFDYSSYKTLLKSMELPTPNYTQSRFTETGLNVTTEINNVISAHNNLQQKLQLNSSDPIIQKLYEKEKEDARILLLKTKINLLQRIKDFKQTDIIEEDGQIIEYTPILYTEEMNDQVQQVLNMINAHNDYFNVNPKAALDGFKNSVSSKIQRVISDPKNILSGYTPINMDDPKAAAKNSASGRAIASMTNWNPVTKFLLTVQNMSGKQVIGIAATGEKIFFALSYFYNELVQSGDLYNEKLRNNAFFQATLKKLQELKGTDAEGKEYTYKEIVDIFRHSSANINFDANTIFDKDEDFVIVDGQRLSKKKAVWYGLIKDAMTNECTIEQMQEALQNEFGMQEDQSLIISALLSAATDNAKELILSKINAGPDLAGLYLHMIIMGYSFQEAADLMTSPTIEAIAKLCETNAFSRYNYNSKGIVDKSVKLLEEGPQIAQYGAMRYEKNFMNHAKEYLKRIHNDENIPFKLTDQQLKNLTNAQVKALLIDPTVPIEIVDENGIIVDSIFQQEEDFKFQRWIDQVKYIRLLRSNIDLNVLEAFKHLKKQANLTTSVGALLGANQGFDTDFGGKLSRLQKIQRIMTDAEASAKIYKKDLSKFDITRARNSFLDKVLGKQSKDGRKGGLNSWLSEEYVLEAFENAVQQGIYGQNFKIDLFLDPNNKAYREAAIAYFNCIKETYNPYALIDYLPHFKAMYEVYHFINTADNYLMSKYRKARKIMDKLVQEELHGEYFTDEELDKLQYALDQESASKWINEQNISITLNTGDQFIDIDGNIREVSSPTEVNLSTDEGKATFKLWVETSVIPSLKKGMINGEPDLIGDNQFISDLQPDEYNHPLFRRRIPYFKLPINLLHHDSGSNSRQYDRYVSDFKRLRNFKWNGMSLQDIFFIYNMITNLNRFGATRLTSIFGPSIEYEDSLAYKYNQYVGEQDYNNVEEGPSIDHINLQDILIKIAPISTRALIDTHKEPYILITMGKDPALLYELKEKSKRKTSWGVSEEDPYDGLDGPADEADEDNDEIDVESSAFISRINNRKNIRSDKYQAFHRINNKSQTWFSYFVLTDPFASDITRDYSLLKSDNLTVIKAKLRKLMRRGNLNANINCS